MTEEYNDDINSIANSVGAWGFKLYEEETFPREDYRELLELTLVSMSKCSLLRFANQVRYLSSNQLLIFFSLLSAGAHITMRDLRRTEYTTLK